MSDDTIDFPGTTSKAPSNDHGPIIDYNTLIRAAHLNVVKDAIQIVSDTGPAEFFNINITYDLMHPDSVSEEWLWKKYPEKITIILNNQYENLHVEDTGFRVTLHFGGSPVALFVPFDSILSYVDMVTRVMFSFEDPHANEPVDNPFESVDTPDIKLVPDAGAEVISLDAFRDKNKKD